MSKKITIDKDFFDKVLSQVDALSRRVEYLEKLKVKIDLNDFKKMLKMANDEMFAEIMKLNPHLNIQTIPPQING